MRLNRTLVLALVALGIVAILVVASGGNPLNFFAQDCQRKAQSMHMVGYYYHILDGCWLQQANGQWIPADNFGPNNVQRRY